MLNLQQTKQVPHPKLGLPRNCRHGVGRFRVCRTYTKTWAMNERALLGFAAEKSEWFMSSLLVWD